MLPPGQLGVWGISLSTAYLVQTAHGLKACVPRTPTLSSDVIPSPSTYLFPKIPSLPGVWRHCTHCAHLGQLDVQDIHVSCAELGWRAPEL